jgi:hypothetical protein
LRLLSGGGCGRNQLPVRIDRESRRHTRDPAGKSARDRLSLNRLARNRDSTWGVTNLAGHLPWYRDLAW